jgi:hypothetical protein
MRTSSVRQLEFPGLDGDRALIAAQNAPSISTGATQGTAEASVISFTPLSGPDASAYTHTSRLIARLNTTMIKPEEERDLLEERRALLDKKLNETMTRSDENRLEYIRWSLDRIEDSRSGAALEALQASASGLEHFFSDMSGFMSQLNRASNKRRRSKK